jgi:diacylglycerol kinase family enzyme
MRLSPGAALDDQKMEVCLIEALRRLEILRCFPMLLRGTHPRHPKVRYFSAPSVEVDSEPPAALQLDGDVIGHTPATFTLRPRSLRVVAPTANPAL